MSLNNFTYPTVMAFFYILTVSACAPNANGDSELKPFPPNAELARGAAYVPALECPSNNNSIDKAGGAKRTETVFPADFYLGEGTCKQLSQEAKVIFDEVKAEAKSECEQPNSSQCESGCTTVIELGSCDPSKSHWKLLKETYFRDALPGKPRYSCKYEFHGKAEGLDSVDCIQEDDAVKSDEDSGYTGDTGYTGN